MDQKYKCAKRGTKTETLKYDDLTCEFNMDAIRQRPEKLFPPGGIPPDLNTSEISWSCRLALPTQICDGYSQCLTDECGCENSNSTSDVFYCADGSGCVTWDKLCDDTQDCKDGSDECACPDHLVFFSTEIGQWACFSEEYYCENLAGLSTASDTESLFHDTPDILKKVNCGKGQEETNRENNPIASCFEIENTVVPQKLLALFCRVNCSVVSRFSDGWERYCDNIVSGIHDGYQYSFLCNRTDYSHGLSLYQVCNGEIDCGNGADESGCPFPDRFHCDPNVTAEWVHIDKVCDSVKDCSNGADECGTCQFEALSSPEFLIQSKIIVAVTSIMGVLIIVLNIKEGYKCWKMDCTSKNKAIDRTLLLQIFLCDTLMGVYLCCIVFTAMILKFKGDYCIVEQDWRASSICSTLGVIFSFSSHGSLLAIAAVSITRFISCQGFFREMSKRTVIVGSITGASVNLLHSALPLMPINSIQNAFRTAIYLENLNENPFFNSNPVNLSRLDKVYNQIFHQDGGNDIHKMSKELNNITSKHNIFDVIEIGYYGNTGLCVHNIFKDHGDQYLYRVYKILYCAVLLALLSVVCFSYVKIVLKQRHSNKAVANLNATTGSNSADLTLKVALMIGSQLACWISFVMTVMYFQYMTKNPATPMAFEVFALVIIPINSFLNPVFYSELYKKLMRYLYMQWRKIVDVWHSKFRPVQPRPEPAPKADVLSTELQSFNGETSQGSASRELEDAL